MLERIGDLVAPGNAAALASAAERARTVPQATLAAMAECTLRLYDAVARAGGPESTPAAPAKPPTRLRRVLRRLAPSRLRAAVKARLR